MEVGRDDRTQVRHLRPRPALGDSAVGGVQAFLVLPRAHGFREPLEDFRDRLGRPLRGHHRGGQASRTGRRNRGQSRRDRVRLRA